MAAQRVMTVDDVLQVVWTKEFLLTVVSPTVVGILAGVGTAVFASYRASAELRSEASRLQQLSELVLYVLLNPGAKIEAKRDAAGNVIGIIVSTVGKA